jgi:hypothetical protein
MIKTSTPSNFLNESFNELPRKHILKTILNYSKALKIQNSKLVTKITIILN